MAKVHKKPSSSEPGKIISVEKPIHSSNVSHFKGDKPEKIKFVKDENGKNFSKIS
jgi:ribosomal protein L24